MPSRYVRGEFLALRKLRSGLKKENSIEGDRMDKEHLDKSAFENYKISIVQGGGCPCAGRITRAVIELSDDISPAMPRMKRLIEGCGYNPKAHVAAFRFKDMGVIVERHKITITNAEDEATAQTVMDWLINTIDGTDQKVTKQEVN
jgi:ArsR family metal-binding transcriptional regulator